MRSTYLGCARRYTTERKRCGDTRGREKQARKPIPEADRQKAERKLGVESKNLSVKAHVVGLERKKQAGNPILEAGNK